MRQKRPVIAINEQTGERKEFLGLFEVSTALGVNHVVVMTAINNGQAVRGWKVYDTPENIRKRIQKLEDQIKMLG